MVAFDATSSCHPLRIFTRKVGSPSNPASIPARNACARLPSMSMSPLKYASRKPTWPKSRTRHAARPLRIRMVTSGARSWFCHEPPSAKTTRKQTSVFAPISSMVFLNREFMVAVGVQKRERDLDTFSRSFEAPAGSASLSDRRHASTALAPRRAVPRRDLRLRPDALLRPAPDARGGAVPLDRERRPRRVLAAARLRRRRLREELAGRDAALRRRREGRGRDGAGAHRQGSRREGAHAQR